MEIASTFPGGDFLTVFNVVRVFAVLTVTFFLTMLLTPLWLRILAHYKVGKQIKPSGHAPVFHELHKHKEGTPIMGGVLIWATVAIVTLAVWFLSDIVGGDWSKFNFLSRGQTWVPLGMLLVAGILGWIDDLFGALRKGPNGGGLRMKVRIFLYTLISVFGAWWFYFKLDFDTINVPFLGDYVIGPWYFLFFILVIMSTAFSANETDGLDGLSSGVFLTMFGAYGVIAFVQGRMDLVVFIAAISGALIAFLWHNIFPAKIFMGDTGAMSLGVVIGVIAMLTNAPILLIPIGIIFVIESGSVILQVSSKKLRKGKKIFLSTPIHHHFEARGWHESTVTMRFWAVSAIGAIIGVIIFLIDSKLPPLL
ncbi:MAG: phospho-N-acetylmuramoyl-pentapeptide-transferase [Parcubacteria group bacterium]